MRFEPRARANARVVVPPRSERERWQREYERWLRIGDLVVIVTAVGVAHVMRFGGTANPPLAATLPLEVRYTVVSALLGLVWVVCLSGAGTRSPRIFGSPEEYRRLLSATMTLFGLIAILSLVFHLDIARGYLAIALPLGLVGLTAQRWWWRHWLTKRRLVGDCGIRVLVVGSRDAASAMIAAFSRDPGSGYQVVGMCTPDIGLVGIAVGDRTIPVVGDDRSVLAAVRYTQADTVAITATDDLGPADFRHMAWELDQIGVELIVAPGLVDISGTRLTHQLVASMPMLHVGKPQYDRARSNRKALFDICFALLAVTMLSPVLLAIAIAVKVTSTGPVFYLSERIGRNGRPFPMIKFRSMYVDADRHVDALIAAQGGNTVFFKMKDDPRVTPVGKVIRKYSLDELPQFFNVLRGEMSVVGPRPQVRREVDSYDGVMWRRLLVKPGLTGLWQVSGRSNLSPEDSMNLDLSYVENWSMVLDLLLVSRTLGAVLRGEGAY
ncbi:sugar transferase [Nocardia aurantia]|uniref:UDP-glucose:undecaprenyl-phosphate glucose-1-phosphate transferase n=1 Tax=Nocardia aurantia TaxID=2585199 RepID=A0A7K0DGN9_9NOCA|nr:sugar transferase [Nocardia aurantia]MQY24839.1 UDP-glucose:undecaprenyl-phosphate glucose-1-phosphate transferase [Nocardia aurantia]